MIATVLSFGVLKRVSALSLALGALLAASPAAAQFGGGGGTTGIALTIGDWVPAWDGYGGWGVAIAGGGQGPVPWTRQTTLPLTPGTYDVYWIQDFDTRNTPMLLAAGVEVMAGAGLVPVQANSGVRLEVADWAPARDPEYGWWGAVAAGAGPNAPINWSRTAEALLLPPGSYDIYWAQEFITRDAPMLMAAGVEIGRGELVPIPIDTGNRLEVAEWVPDRDPEYGWWGAVAAGGDPDAPVNWTRTADALLLPAGDYDVYWAQDFNTRDQPMLLATGTLEAGQLATLRAISGIMLEIADWVPPRDPEYGWWGAVAAGGDADDLVNWTRTAEALLLPPGQYDVYWAQDFATRDQPLALARSVFVPDAAFGVIGVEFALDGADVRVVGVTRGSPADRAGVLPGDILLTADGRSLAGLTLNDVAALIRGAPETPVSLAIRRDGAASPITLKITRAPVEPLRVVRADSGIRAVVAAGVPPLDPSTGWWGAVPVNAPAEDRVNWAVGNASQPLLLGPGTYDIYWAPNRSDAQLKAVGVEVTAGTVLDVAITAETIPGSVVVLFAVGTNEAPNAGAAFPQGVREVEAFYEWQNAATGTPLGVRWYLGDQMILEQGEPVTVANGRISWTLRMVTGEPLPAGAYRVELIEPNRPPRSLGFTIGG